MRHAIAALMWILIVISLAGCGGGLTQEDMMRNAIHRPSSKGGDAPAPGAANSLAAPANDSGDADSAHSTEQVAVSASSAAAGLQGSAATPPEVAPAAPPQQSARIAATPEQQRERSVENITRISQALQKYVAEQGMYPPAAIGGTSATAGLSWRVALLPYLGYSELYHQFKLDQAWDSPHNLPLLQQIPDVYQAPHRPDERTNYLVPTGRYMAFARSTGELLSNFEDGIGSTVVLLEVDDSYAVPWTKAADYPADGSDPKIGLGKLHETFFLAVWGDGTVYEISSSISAAAAWAMLTIDGGEPLDRNFLGGPPGTLVAGQQNSSGAAGSGTLVAAASPASPLLQAGDLAAAAKDGGMPSKKVPLVRLPLPDAAEQKRARETFREIYEIRYRAATTAAQRRDFAQHLLATRDDVREHPASLYVLLQIARDIAVGAGDTKVALEAADSLAHHFELDAIDEVAATLDKLAETAASGANQKLIGERSLTILGEVIAEERHSDCVRLARIAVAAARKAQDRTLLGRAALMQAQVNDWRSAYEASVKALKILEDQPEDPAARYALGRYLCIYQGDWENGLPILAESSASHLRMLAQRELERPSEADARVALGDAWWKAAQDADPGDQPAMYGRALHWYELALPQIPAGLVRVKILQRLQVVSK